MVSCPLSYLYYCATIELFHLGLDWERFSTNWAHCPDVLSAYDIHSAVPPSLTYHFDPMAASSSYLLEIRLCVSLRTISPTSCFSKAQTPLFGPVYSQSLHCEATAIVMNYNFPSVALQLMTTPSASVPKTWANRQNFAALAGSVSHPAWSSRSSTVLESGREIDRYRSSSRRSVSSKVRECYRQNNWLFLQWNPGKIRQSTRKFHLGSGEPFLECWSLCGNPCFLVRDLRQRP